MTIFTSTCLGKSQSYRKSPFRFLRVKKKPHLQDVTGSLYVVHDSPFEPSILNRCKREDSALACQHKGWTVTRRVRNAAGGSDFAGVLD